MAINKESNSYTIIFSIIMCVIVGTMLAVAAMALKPAQDANIKNEKKQNILAAINVTVERDNATAEYDKYIKEVIVLDATGKISKEKVDAFEINALAEYKDKPEGERLYPLFIAEKDGKKLFVMPMAGMGLWAGVWGYVSVGDDYNTIVGASFAHKGETPGLGAEISTPLFTDQFPGKKINDESGKFISIHVVKPGSVPANDHIVDGISGGTFTSKGVDEMLSRSLKVYDTYFKSLKTTANN